MKYHHPVPVLEIHYGENCHTFKFCSDFTNITCVIGLSLQCFIKIPRIQADPQFPLNGVIWAMVVAWVLFHNYIWIDPVCSVISSRMPSSTRYLISSLKASSRWIGTFVGESLAGLCSGLGEICMVPLEIVLYLQSDPSSVSIGVCSQKSYHWGGCWTFLEATESLWQLVDMCTGCWRSTLWSVLHGKCVCMYWIHLLCCHYHWWSWKEMPTLDFCIGYVLLAVVSVCHPISGIHLMYH